MFVLCSTASIAAKAQLYEIDGFDSRFAVVFLMAVSEASALRLQRFDQRTHEGRHPEVSTRCKIVFDARLVSPSGARVILLLAQECSASAEEILMTYSIQM